MYNEMETACEFCGGVRAVVYCKADAACLCLCCDAKIHSANALSNRHLRTLLCDACNCRPCSVRCFDHSMFMCHGCNSKLHTISCQHQRRMVNCFTGCPLAKEFATLWGFQSNKANDNSVSDQVSSVSCTDSVAGSSSQQVYISGRLQRDDGFIFQQILELEKLQVSERNDGSILMGGHQQADITSSICDQPEGNGGRLDHGSDKSHDPLIDMSDLMMDLSSTAGDSFWQSEVPSQDDQLWYQNLQDIGVCQDLVYTDDFNIPDIDLTFRNFEELFGADQEPILGIDNGNNVSSSSSVKKNASFGESDNGCPRTTKQDASPSNESYASVSEGKSLSALRHDTELPSKIRQEPSCSLPRGENLHLGGRENPITRRRGKRKTPESSRGKQAGYISHGARNNPRRKVKDGHVKTLNCCGVTSNVTRS